MVRDFCDGLATVEENTLRDGLIVPNGTGLDGDRARPRVMMDAHGDEVGGMVRTIRANGTMGFVTLGRFPEGALCGQDVLVRNARGEWLHGTIGVKPPHFTSAAEKAAHVPPEMILDVGATSAEMCIRDSIYTAGEPITQLSYTINSMQSALASVERVFDVLDEPEIEPDPAPELAAHVPQPMQGRVSFEHVKFGYTPEKTLMKDEMCIRDRMRMAYSSTAEMRAICMACAPTRLPPSQITHTSTTVSYTHLVVIIELFLQRAHSDLDQEVEAPVERCRNGKGHHAHLRGDKRLCGREHLGHANCEGKRRVLDERNYLVAHSRQDALDHLGQHDAEKRLHLGVAQNLGRFVLATRNGLNARTVNLGKIRSVVDDKSDDARVPLGIRR